MLKNKILIIFLFALISFYLGTSIPFFITSLADAGKYLINVQGADEYLIAVGWTLALTGVIALIPVASEVKKTLLILWMIRTFITLFAMLFYESYYGLDAYEYYKNIMRHSFDPELMWGNGTNFIVGVGIFLNEIFPFGTSYHAFKVVWSFFGFLAILPLYNIFKMFVNEGKDDTRVLWALGAFPSLLFWTSILGKDPLASLGIACTAYGLLRLQRNVDLRGLLWAVAGLVLLSFVRFWLAAIFLAPAVICFAWGQSERKIWRYFGMAISTAALVYVADNIQAILAITSGAEALESLNQVSSSWSRGGSSLQAPSFSNPVDIIAFLPLGMLTAIFRPLPGEVNNIFGIISGLESLVIIYLFFTTIKKMNFKLLRNPIILYFYSAIVIWGSFYAFISYQNLGTAVRFRAQILPFIILLYFVVQSITQEKWKKMPKPRIQPAKIVKKSLEQV